MSHGCSRYVRVYQNIRYVRSVGGSAGQQLIKEFWDNKNPRSVIVKDLKMPNGQIAFPSDSITLPYLVYKKNKNDVEYFSGSLYLIEIQKRSTKRRIKNIYAAIYHRGNLVSFYHLKSPIRIWYDKDQFGHSISVHLDPVANNSMISIDGNLVQRVNIVNHIRNPQETV